MWPGGQRYNPLDRETERPTDSRGKDIYRYHLIEKEIKRYLDNKIVRYIDTSQYPGSPCVFIQLDLLSILLHI
jgi:hypothetical protein